MDNPGIAGNVGDVAVAGTTDRDSTCVPVRLFVSVTSTVNVVVPIFPAPGVPVIAPVEVLRLAQPGRLPEEMLHVYGVVPLVAASVAEYAFPTAASGRDVVVTIGDGLGTTAVHTPT